MRLLQLSLLSLLAVLVAVDFFAAAAGGPASAAFPGANGKIVFLSGRGVSSQQIYVMNADGSDQVRLTNDLGYEHFGPAWSPDGSQIMFTRFRPFERQMDDEPSDDAGPGIFVMNANGSGQRKLTDSLGHEPAWSPDGSRVAFMRGWDIYVTSADGGDQTNLTDHAAMDEHPTWSPDGSQIAFVRRENDNYDIYITNADGGGLKRLTHERKDDPTISFRIDWSPDGSQIAFAAGFHGDIDIYVVSVDGSGQNNLTDDLAANVFPAWSPDGSQIAFMRGAEGADIYVMNADGSDLTNVTDSSARELTFTWSPDGSQIAFAKIPDGGGNMDIYAVNVDGSGEMRLTDDPAGDYYPDWQPLPIGDVNCGGGINSIDAALVLQLDAGLVASLPCQENADVNEDGSVTSIDATLILEYDAGLIDRLPPA